MDDDFLPISALQHMAFCERQCGLIHLEREWKENDRTAEGRVLHESVDEGYRAYRRGLKQFSGLYIRSEQFGIAGRLDVLELHQQDTASPPFEIRGFTGSWALHPVEFKRGKPKKHDADRVQLCAQVLCLEEMTGQAVQEGSFFYGQLRRRDLVSIDVSLRERTRQVINRLRLMLENRVLPSPVWKRHCRSCSLMVTCQPQSTSGTATAEYRKALLG